MLWIDKLELVSPAGSWNQLKAAANAGADAVYLAYERYGARAYAENFDFASLEKAVFFSHSKNIKVYLALNTLIKEKELNEFIDFIFQALNKINFNGIIIQDFAAKKIISEIFPEIPIHASTQLNAHNSFSLKFLKEAGFKRTVLAREMTLEELKEISSKKIMDIEIFGHGSQCYSYSGQCYFSSFTGERSGNRGRCPQPCRMKYKLIQEPDQQNNGLLKKAIEHDETIGDYYFLSKSDLITIFYLPEIIKAGVKALKLEGRMKTPEYVGIMTRIYRKYIDLFYENPDKFNIDEQDIYKLKQIYAREINEGYLKERFPENIVSLKKSGSVGSYFGRVYRIESEKSLGKYYKNIYIKSDTGLNKNDVLEIWTKKGNDRIKINDYELISGNSSKKNLYKVTIDNKINLNLNDRIFKYFDYNLDKEAKSLYLFETSYIPEDINIKNDFKIENYYKLKSLLKKTRIPKDNSGAGSFTSNSKINYKISDSSFKIPSISLFFYNESEKSKAILKNILSIIHANKVKYGRNFTNINLCYEDSYNLFKENNEDELKKLVDIYDSLKNENANFYLVTPNIAYDAQIYELEKMLVKLVDLGLNNFYVSNSGILFLLNKISDSHNFPLNIILGYNFNLFNSFAINEIKKQLNKNIKISGIILSAELTLPETSEIISDLNKNEELKSIFNETDFSIYSYGFYPVMTSRVRYEGLIGNTNDLSNFTLKDLKNFKFKLSHDYLNNTQLFNSKKHCLIFDIKEIIVNHINGFLVDLRFLEEEEIYFIFKSFLEGLMLSRNINDLKLTDAKSSLSYIEKYETMIFRLSKSSFLTNYTKGHLFREVI